jgi:hypothetical protein
MPIPPVPPEMIPAPSPLGVTTGAVTGRLELAILLKVTYQFDVGKPLVRAAEQLPLSTTNEAHEALTPGAPASMKAVPELLAFSSGTDVIVRGHARSRVRRTFMRVGVVIGSHRHTAEAIGRRVVDLVNGKLVFSSPEPFESMPLRYELAYGGIDVGYEAMVAALARKELKPEDLRRLGPLAEGHLHGVPPVAYPRNRYGKGYVMVAEPKALVGRELPNIEFTDDRITPERLIPTKPLRWLGLPVPAGFDYMDELMFPRSAMMGLPPMADGNLNDIGEVRRGQVPKDYCRGNAIYAERESVPGLIHPELARCAPIGLRLPFLQGNETVVLQGMSPAADEWAVTLPGERPVIRLSQWELQPQLFQLFIDADKKHLSMVWCARTPWARPLGPGEDREILGRVKVSDAWTRTAAARR